MKGLYFKILFKLSFCDTLKIYGCPNTGNVLCVSKLESEKDHDDESFKDSSNMVPRD